MEQSIKDAIDRFSQHNDSYAQMVEDYIVDAGINSVDSLKEAYEEITGDVHTGLSINDMMQGIMSKEEYAKFS